MNIVFIDKSDIAIEVENKTLKVDGKKIPLRLIDSIIISSKNEFCSKDILKIVSEDISIIIHNPNTQQLALIQGAAAKNSALKYAQYSSLSSSLSIAKYFVGEKIKRHAAGLLPFDMDCGAETTLQDVQNAKSMDELLGLEGSFARTYFALYFSLIHRRYHNNRRTKRPPLDPANALLSYMYSMLYYILTVKLVSYGFEPGIGYLHMPFRTHNALSSDMMELFRHEINGSVVRYFKEEIVVMDDFYKKGGVYLNYEGRKKLYPYIKELWSCLEPKIAFEIAHLRSMICKSVI
jgi:CRISPR-associated protein Cas1